MHRVKSRQHQCLFHRKSITKNIQISQWDEIKHPRRQKYPLNRFRFLVNNRFFSFLVSWKSLEGSWKTVKNKQKVVECQLVNKFTVWKKPIKVTSGQPQTGSTLNDNFRGTSHAFFLKFTIKIINTDGSKRDRPSKKLLFSWKSSFTLWKLSPIKFLPPMN